MPTGSPDGEAGEVRVAVVGGAGERDEADRADRAGEERARVHRPAQLLEHDGEVDHAHARAAVRLGHEQPDDARARRGPARRRRRTAVVVECGRGRRASGARSARNRRDGLAQQLLVVGELEVHAVALLGGSAARDLTPASGYATLAGTVRPCDCATDAAEEAFRAELTSLARRAPAAARGARAAQAVERRPAAVGPGVAADAVRRRLARARAGRPSSAGATPTPVEQMIYFEEMSRREIPRSLNPQGLGIIAPSIRDYGTAEQRERFLLPTLRAEIAWCLGMSEPSAGSDLASLRTRAVLDGDHFVVNGQKVWTSGAHHADWCLCFVRTDPDVPKHKGISALIIDMKTPGVEPRPFPELTEPDFLDFNEVFFTDVARAAREPARRAQPRLADHAGLARARAGDALDRLRVQPRPGVAGARRARRRASVPTAGASATTRCSATRSPSIAIDAQALLCMGYRGFSKFMAGKSAPEHSLLKLFGSESVQRALQIGIEAEGVAGPRHRRASARRCGARARG